MRRVLLMVMAIAAFMCVGAASAFAGDTPPKPNCKYGVSKGKCKPKPCKYGSEHGKCKPQPCKYGSEHGKCKPQPCEYGSTAGKCNPKPCPYGKGDDDKCNPGPIVVPPPESGACSKADLVLLEDLLKGTGGLLCLYLGDKADLADKAKDCPDALLALPLDPLLGACLFLPPAEVGQSATADTGATSMLSGLTGVTADNGAVGSIGLQGIISMITGLLGRATTTR